MEKICSECKWGFKVDIDRFVCCHLEPTTVNKSKNDTCSHWETKEVIINE